MRYTRRYPVGGSGGFVFFFRIFYQGSQTDGFGDASGATGMWHLDIYHRFHAVGQGTFASGRIKWSSHQPGRHPFDPRAAGKNPERCFSWVYDCGSSTSQALVDRGIQDVSRDLPGGILNLLTISHFHADHISGIIRLLNAVVRADMLILPWAPLWQRLLLGFEQGLNETDPLFGFYVDPAGYLAEAAPGRFRRILFVLPWNDEGRRRDPDEPFPSDPERSEGGEDGREPYEPLNDSREFPESDANRKYARKLEAGRPLHVGEYWEFLPYNDPGSAPQNAVSFKAAVNDQRKKLLGADNSERAAAFKALRRLYVECVPRNMQNALSLSLYAGPVPLYRWEHSASEVLCHDIMKNSYSSWECRRADGTVPILYTGDGDFSVLSQWFHFYECLGDKRLHAIGTFQVPHHGSKNNWGCDRAFYPNISVFACDPRKFRHPDAGVLRYFRQVSRAVLVDRYTEYTFFTRLDLPYLP